MSPKENGSTNPKFDPKDQKGSKDFKNPKEDNKKGKKDRKGPKNGSKGGNRGGEPGKGDFSAHSVNDTFWYTLNPEVLRDSASLPFSYPLGGTINPGASSDVSIGFLRRGQASAPGIFRLNWRPTVGLSDTALSPINIAAGKFYAFVRQANSGSRNYEKSDLIMYFMAMASVYARIEMAKRAYGLLKTYSNYNKYLGRAVVAAAGFDWDDLSDNQANFRMRLNELINQVNGCFHIPSNFKYIERQLFLNRIVVADRPNKKFQTFIPYMGNYLEFDGTSSSEGSCLLSVNNNGSRSLGFSPYVWTVLDYIDSLQNQVAKLVANEDISIMSGDILKAYGTSGCYTMDSVDLEYVTPIVYDLPFLAQIHNTCTNAHCESTDVRDVSFYTPTAFAPANCVVYQHKNIIYSFPYYAANADGTNDVGYTDDVILNIPVDEPTPGDVMESTRNMFMVDGTKAFSVPGVDSMIDGMPVICGSELFTSFVVYHFTTAGALNADTFKPTGLSINNDTISITDQWYFRALTLYSAFDWAPLLTVATGVDLPAHDNEVDRVSVIGDLTNYTR